MDHRLIQDRVLIRERQIYVVEGHHDGRHDHALLVDVQETVSELVLQVGLREDLEVSPPQSLIDFCQTCPSAGGGEG